MRRIRYAVATSLDGYIAGPNGEADWITMDPEIDFAEIYAEFDTFLMGRRTFEAAIQMGEEVFGGMRTYVFSKTLQQSDYPKVTVVAADPERTVRMLQAQPGKDIWLFGGGALFRYFLSAGLVDTVEVAIMPVLLGCGIQLLPQPATSAKLKLADQKTYKSGIVSLKYDIIREGRRA